MKIDSLSVFTFTKSPAVEWYVNSANAFSPEACAPMAKQLEKSGEPLSVFNLVKAPELSLEIPPTDSCPIETCVERPMALRRGPGRKKDPHKREAIIAAAVSLFCADGFAHVSMERIAELADVSKLTLYSHFKDKRDLFGCVVAKKAEYFLSPTTLKTLLSLPFQEALFKLSFSYIDIITRDDVIKLYALVIADCKEHPEAADLFFASGPGNVLSFYETFFKFFRQNGAFSSDQTDAHLAEHVVALLKGSLFFGLLLGRRTKPTEADLQAYVERCLAGFYGGFARLQ